MLPEDEPILSDVGGIDTNSNFTVEMESKVENLEEIVICAFDCSEQNVKRCRKCNRPFCIMHCNIISPNFCKGCFKDLSIISEKFKRIFDHISKSGQLWHETQENTRFYMDGPDWPFVTPWIHTLSDTELKSLWVFHYSIMKLIESENETRRIEYNRKQREGQLSTRLITKSSTSSTGTKTRVIKVADTPDDLRKKWKKQGLPDATIEIMIKAMNI